MKYIKLYESFVSDYDVKYFQRDKLNAELVKVEKELKSMRDDSFDFVRRFIKNNGTQVEKNSNYVLSRI